MEKNYSWLPARSTWEYLIRAQIKVTSTWFVPLSTNNHGQPVLITQYFECRRCPLLFPDFGEKSTYFSSFLRSSTHRWCPRALMVGYFLKFDTLRKQGRVYMLSYTNAHKWNSLYQPSHQLENPLADQTLPPPSSWCLNENEEFLESLQSSTPLKTNGKNSKDHGDP